MKLSIIIRSLNEEKYLEELLTKLSAQTYSDFEIIMVDSGSTDNTLNIINGFSCKLVEIRKSEFSFGRSLNYGCKEASGDMLVFISAHCIPKNDDWLKKLVEQFKDPEVALCYGRQIGYKSSKFSEHQVFEKYFPPKKIDEQGGFFCNNANSAIRRSLWEQRPFDEELTGLEDMDWAKYHYYKGYKIKYAPEAVIYHIHEETWKKVKIRYEREAFALKEIMPEIHFTLLDFLKSVLKGITNDLKKNIAINKIPNKFIEIVLFRLCQFYGSYMGNHSHRKLSKSKKENYFYP